ncbi:MAG: polysaccharide deacetylase family protein [Deltaproteobacteria bacterium]|nr:polysaccharide deacetylase family protein [Deltaproteobacteria bacterium]
MSPVPVFMYHHVNPHKGDMVTVTPGVFDAQMKFLSETGYRTLSAGELVEFAGGNLAINGKAVAVTFDDGYLDNYVYAFPVLKRYGIKATIFLATDWVEKASMVMNNGAISIPSHKEGKGLMSGNRFHKVVMNWDMIREMQESKLVEFYSHTMTHRKCAELPEDELKRELKDSKTIIEERLRRPCPYLCWPKGSYNESSIRIAKESGYKALFTTERDIVKHGSDRFHLGRIVVKDDIKWFKRKLLIYTNPLLTRLYLAVRGRK